MLTLTSLFVIASCLARAVDTLSVAEDGNDFVATTVDPDNTICTRHQICNGIMCKDVCEIGSVQIDPFVSEALAFQRALQLHEPLMKTTLIGTHNSAISQAYGFGIEEDYIEGLLGKPFYTGDDLGEGVCQSLSVLDQLRLGLRHIEIDITSGYFEIFDPKLPRVNQIFVCHSPFPLDPELVLEIEAKAAEEHIDLKWDPKNLSCEHTNVPFRIMLLEIKGWLNDNPNEIVVLYLDTKPLTVDLPSQAAAMYDVMISVLGEDAIWKVKDGNPLNMSRAELLAKGKRVIFEDHDNGYNHPAHGDVLVFTPDLWKHQFGASDLIPYPNCSISGDDKWYGTEFVRALGTNDSFIQNANDCGVNIVSPNYITPDDVAQFVWTFEWGTLNTSGCVSRLPSGKWTVESCATKRFGACRAVDNDRQWATTEAPVSGTDFMASGQREQRVSVDGAVAPPLCPAGYVALPPTNGYTNNVLGDMVAAAKQNAVWLHVLPSGLQP